MKYMPSLEFQVIRFIYSSGLGFTLGMVYDFLKILFFIVTGSDKKLVPLRDIIYVIVCFFAVFIFLIVLCDGRLSLFVFLSGLAGAYAYFYSLSNLVLIPFKTTMKHIKSLLRKINDRFSAIKECFCIFIEKNLKLLHKTSKKDLHIRHNIVYNFFVKLRLCNFIKKKRGDEDGEGSKEKT